MERETIAKGMWYIGYVIWCVFICGLMGIGVFLLAAPLPEDVYVGGFKVFHSLKGVPFVDACLVSLIGLCILFFALPAYYRLFTRESKE